MAITIEMKRLYETVLENESRWLGELSKVERSTATPAAIQSAETKLGVSLPETFKQFARRVGAASWPLHIYSVDALAPYPPDWERPSYLIAFATDGGGNDWCFDTRKLQSGEYAIVFWDHEEPPDGEELDAQAAATPFDEWLEDVVTDKLNDDEREALAERRSNIERALERYRETNTWPWAPSEEDLAGVEASIGFALPRDYVWFTTKLGSTTWPIEIPDALEMGRLTEEMRKRFPAAGAVVAFGRETDGSFVGLEKDGRLVAIGGRAIEDRSFFDFLERRIKERSEPSSPADDIEVRAE